MQYSVTRAPGVMLIFLYELLVIVHVVYVALTVLLHQCQRGMCILAMLAVHYKSVLQLSLIMVQMCSTVTLSLVLGTRLSHSEIINFCS